jgi:uncharacterized protein
VVDRRAGTSSNGKTFKGVTDTAERGRGMTDVRDNPGQSRYELLEDGKLVGVADYRAIGDTLAFPHTEIVPARRNQGLGAQLVKGALDDVRRKGAKVVPYCWFVAEFIDEHPEYADLLA